MILNLSHIWQWGSFFFFADRWNFYLSFAVWNIFDSALNNVIGMLFGIGYIGSYPVYSLWLISWPRCRIWVTKFEIRLRERIRLSLFHFLRNRNCSLQKVIFPMQRLHFTSYTRGPTWVACFTLEPLNHADIWAEPGKLDRHNSSKSMKWTHMLNSIAVLCYKNNTCSLMLAVLERV